MRTDSTLWVTSHHFGYVEESVAAEVAFQKHGPLTLLQRHIVRPIRIVSMFTLLSGENVVELLVGQLLLAHEELVDLALRGEWNLQRHLGAFD